MFGPYRTAEEYRPAGKPQPDWHGKRASAALPPHWWSVPRDHANGIQVSHAEPALWAWIGTLVLVALFAVTVFMLAMVIR